MSKILSGNSYQICEETEATPQQFSDQIYSKYSDQEMIAVFVSV